MANPSLNLDKWMFANGYKYTSSGIRRFGTVTSSPAEFDVYIKVTVMDSWTSRKKTRTYFAGSLHMCTIENRHDITNVATVIRSADEGSVLFSEFESGALGGDKETLG